MAGVDALEVALGRHGDDALGPHLADDARQVAAQVERRLDATVGVAEEHEVGDADVLGRRGLLVSAQLRHLGASDVLVEPARVAVGDDAVGDVDAGVGPRRHAPGDAEVDVVGVRGHDQDPLGELDLGGHANQATTATGATRPGAPCRRRGTASCSR